MHTFGSSHKCVENAWEPTGHQPVLDGDLGNLRISQPLGDEHDANGQSGDEVVNEPTIVVSWQPPHKGYFFKNIIGRGRGESTRALNKVSSCLSPIHVSFQRMTDAVQDLHDESLSFPALSLSEK